MLRRIMIAILALVALVLSLLFDGPTTAESIGSALPLI